MKILVSTLFLILVTLDAYAFEPLFDTRVDYTLSEPANHLVTCDLNGDDCLDIAVAPYYGDSLSILLGNCDGTFQTPVTYGGLDSALSLFAIDLENDGFPDLAVIDVHRTKVTIFKNIGNAFQLDTSYSVGLRLSSIWCADINNDGYTDIIIADYYGTSPLTILFNNGYGVFSTRRQIQLISQAVSIIADDFNNDEIPDIAAVGYSSQPQSALGILINNGHGQFSDTTKFISNGYYTLRAGDINGDGFDDIVAASIMDSLAIYLNNGNGSFQLSTELPAGMESRSIAIDDLNGDESNDLTIVEHYNSHITTYLNNGNGSFAVTDTYFVPAHPRWVSGGDFNLDGHIDMAVASNDGKAVSVLNNDGTGKFIMPSLYDFPVNPTRVYCANLDGNRLSDLVVKTSNNLLALLINQSDMHFTQSFITPAPLEDNTILIGDFNGNSTDDFAIIHHPPIDSLEIRIFYNDGTGNIIGGTRVNIPYYDSPKYYVSELNGDGIDDIIVGGIPDSISVILSNQSGSFNRPVQYHIPGLMTTLLLACDFDSDGLNDIIAGRDTLTIFRNTGNGVLEQATSFVLSSTQYNKIFGIDFDNDSNNDLILLRDYSNQFQLLRNIGNLNFQNAGFIRIVNASTNAIAADINNDNLVDIIPYFQDYGISPYLNQGNSTFTTPFRYGTRRKTPGYDGMFAAGDIDGDRALDIIEAGFPEFPNKISVMLNKTMVQDVLENPNINLPNHTSLLCNYPNPFNAQTTISYSLFTRSNVSIEIFDIAGRKVETLQGGYQEAGEHSIVWNARDRASGVYFYRVKAGDVSKAEKCVLLK